MLTRERILKVLEDIRYKDWLIVLHEKGAAWADHDPGSHGPMFFIQVQFLAIDNSNDHPWCNDEQSEPKLQKCRWWLIDTDKGENEVVRTVYKAIEAAVLHEMQEEFRYRNVAVMDPHRDLMP